MITYSIIKKSQLEGAWRLDAEYYQPEYLSAVQIIKNCKFVKLGDMISTLTDYHANGSYEILRDNVQLSDKLDYALMVRAIDLKTNNYHDNVRFVSEHAYNFLKKTKIYGEEIIIDKIGDAGEVFFMPKLDRPVTLGMNLFMIRLKPHFNPAYLYVFLISRYGKALISQRITGTAPTSIDKKSVKGLLIPSAPKEVVEQVDYNIRSYFKILKDSFSIYKQAENLLIDELVLSDFKDEESLFTVVNLSEVKNAGRIDAEYFQKKYKKLMKKIKQNNWKKLGDLVAIKKGIEPGAEEYKEEGKLFIRVSSLSKNGINLTDEKYLSEEMYNKLKNDFEPKEGEILLTKDATPGIAYVIKDEIQGIMAGGILRLALKDKSIKDEYLALCLNSIIGQMQAERDAGGSVIMHWKPEQIKNVVIPILGKDKQQKIVSFIRQSFAARAKANELLEEAKKKVEEMIEVGEKI